MGDREGRATEGGVALKVSMGTLWVGRDPVMERGMSHGKMCKHSVLSGRANFKCPGLCKKPGVTLMQGTPHPPGKVDTDEGDGQDKPASHWAAWLWSAVEILF